jgi:hypothetical protein
VVVEDVSPTLAPCALAFSPPEHTQAPPYPQWLVDCDAADVVHLSLFAVTEVILKIRDKICGADPSESAWCLVTSLWRETCLPTPFCRTGNPQGLSKADVHGLFRRISSRQQAGPVDPRGDPNFNTPSEVLLLALPGQCHTFALDWKHFSRGVWGEHVGLADRTHPV